MKTKPVTRISQTTPVRKAKRSSPPATTRTRSNTQAVAMRAAELRTALERKCVSCESPSDRLKARALIRDLDIHLPIFQDDSYGKALCEAVRDEFEIILKRASEFVSRPISKIASIWTADGNARPELTTEADECMTDVEDRLSWNCDFFKSLAFDARRDARILTEQAESCDDQDEKKVLKQRAENRTKAAEGWDLGYKFNWDLSCQFWRWNGGPRGEFVVDGDTSQGALNIVGKLIDAGGVEELARSFGEDPYGNYKEDALHTIADVLAALRTDPLFSKK